MLWQMIELPVNKNHRMNALCFLGQEHEGSGGECLTHQGRECYQAARQELGSRCIFKGVTTAMLVG